MLLLWAIVLIASIAALSKGADWFLHSAIRIGKALRFSQFAIGIFIVGFGTSLPELASSIAATLQGTPEVVLSAVIGSNIANVLLIVGIIAIIAGEIRVRKDLIRLDIPLLVAATALLVGTVMDRRLDVAEAIILLAGFVIYLLYTAREKEEEFPKLSKRAGRMGQITARDLAFLCAGALLLILGARYTVIAAVTIADLLGFAVGVVSITAIAIGTSLPELFVSISAIKRREPEVALGNIFGSNIFNALLVTGLSGLFVSLPLGAASFSVGLPGLLLSTLLLVLLGISKKIYRLVGALYVLLFILFVYSVFINHYRG
jgi:cation:H+ antiporter